MMEKAGPLPTSDYHACDDALPSDECVPKAYQGTATDRKDMQMLGKKQVLRRQFKFVTMLGFASTVSRCKSHMLTISSQDMLMCSPFNSGGLGIRPSRLAFWSCRWRHSRGLLGTSAQPYCDAACLCQPRGGRIHESHCRRSVSLGVRASAT